MFIPAAEAHDTSYFMSRYIWNVEDDHVVGGSSDFEDITETCSSRSCSNEHDEDVCCFFRYDLYAPGASMDQTSLVSFVPVSVIAKQSLINFYQSRDKMYSDITQFDFKTPKFVWNHVDWQMVISKYLLSEAEDPKRIITEFVRNI